MSEVLTFGFGIIAISSFWILLFLLAEAVFLTYCAIYEHARSGAISFLALVAVMHLGGAFNAIEFVAYHPFLVLPAVICYALIGVSWARWVKWKFYLSDWEKAVREQRLKFNATRGHTGIEIREEDAGSWDNWKSNNRYWGDDLDVFLFAVPDVWQTKSRFMIWAAYWPFDLTWTVLHDPLVRVYEWGYHVLREGMQLEAKAKAAQFGSDIKG